MSYAAVAGGAAMLIGGGMSTIGSTKAAKAEIKAAAENRAFTERKVQLGQLWDLAQTVGGSDAIEQFKGFLSPQERDQLFGRASKAGSLTDAERTELADLTKEITSLQDPRHQNTTQGRVQTRARLVEAQNRKAALDKKAGGDPGQSATIDEAAIKKITGITGEYGKLADQAGQSRLGNLSRYDATTGDLMRESKGIERYAANMGAGERSRIERDSERGLKSANRAATAALMGRGLGASTALTDAYGGNAEQVGRVKEDALGSLGDRQLQLGTGLRTGRLGMMSGRASGRDAMDLAGQDTERGMRLGMLNMRQASTRAPNWLGSNTAQFFPSASPSAAGLMTAGSAIGSGGSMMFGYGLRNNANSGGGGPDTSLGNMGTSSNWTPGSWMTANGGGNAWGRLNQ